MFPYVTFINIYYIIIYGDNFIVFYFKRLNVFFDQAE